MQACEVGPVFHSHCFTGGGVVVAKYFITHLESKKLIKEYNDVFYQQESEGIIEKIKGNPSKLFNYNWIAHRPVIKFDARVTTKIRPVFNCSLKNKESCSLNEVAYKISDTLRILFSF